jgi:ketosteroid isomerase-like protein
MDNSLKAYAAGNSKFFDYLDDDVRVYTLDSTEPILGRKNFEDYFGHTFASTKRAVVQLHHDLRVSGDQAVLSQTLQISSNGVGLPVRQTVVWAKTKAGWRMTHIHNGRAGEPLVIGKVPRTARGLRVLNERIATVAATVGVAQ